MSLSEAQKLVEEVGPTFVESLCILKVHWFFITSFSVFIHHPGRVDDCAYKSKYAYQDAPIAFIQRKTSYGSSSYELVIRLGYVEVLANSGFIESTTMPNLIPFAGSALQHLPEMTTIIIETASSTDVFKNCEQQDYESSNRIINQYYKKTSTVPWQYNSLRFSKDGFKPVNPLDVTTDLLWLRTGSLIIGTYAFKRINADLTKKNSGRDRAISNAQKTEMLP